MNTPLESATRDHIAAAIAEIITAAVAEIAENRAVIDQVKGMLILLYGVDDQTAFDTLRRHSQNTNIKLRALAEQLVSNYRALSNGDGNLWRFLSILAASRQREGCRFTTNTLFPVDLGVVLWGGLWLRNARVRRLAPLPKPGRRNSALREQTRCSAAGSEILGEARFHACPRPKQRVGSSRWLAPAMLISPGQDDLLLPYTSRYFDTLLTPRGTPH